jgi:hypothetical protein
MAPQVRVKVKTSERLRIILNPENFLEQTGLANAAMEMFEQFHRETVNSAPYDTGKYRRSWQTKSYTDRKRLIMKMWNDTKYAKFLVYGTDIGYSRFIPTALGKTGHSYTIPDPMRGILHDVRRLLWYKKQDFLEEFQKVRTMYRASGRAVGVKNVRTVATSSIFIDGTRQPKIDRYDAGLK